ncbi:MAG TPA: hypothetical protein VN937_19950 [Blastocatellia bacterium]|nr:hypothetical protein [Blastocatellia bacterium]
MSETISDEREDWVRLALRSLARAYDDDEPEYSHEQIKESNPEYRMKRGTPWLTPNTNPFGTTIKPFSEERRSAAVFKRHIKHSRLNTI